MSANNANVIDELIVKLLLDTSQYDAALKGLDKTVTVTAKRANKIDDEDKKRTKARDKRMKDSTAATKTFANSLRGLALTIGSVLGLGTGIGGLVGAVVALTGFETNLRRATVSTGMSNREMQAWGSTARRLGADASAGAQAIADLAREQQQFNLTGNAPTVQAFARMGVRAGPGTNIGDILGQAQTIYRQAAPGQRQQIESGLSASGVSNDLIVMIKSETDAREAYTRSFAESTEENRKALDSVSNAMAGVQSASVQLADTIATIAEPYVREFGKWLGEVNVKIAAFKERVAEAGGGVEGFMTVLDKENPEIADALRGLGTGLRVMGETVDVVVYGFQQLARAGGALVDWLDKTVGNWLGNGNAKPVSDAIGTVGDAIAHTWRGLVGEARNNGAAVVGSSDRARLTPSAQARIDAGALSGRRPTGGNPTAQDLMQYMIANHGVSVADAAAIAANAMAESGLNPTNLNTAGGGQGAQGLFQHRGARIDAFRARNGVNPMAAAWRDQVDFIFNDPYERGLMRRALAGSGGAQAQGSAFSRVFESHGNVAEDLRRGQKAQDLANAYQGGAGGPAININGPVTVQANNPTEFVGGIQRVSGVGNYASGVR